MDTNPTPAAGMDRATLLPSVVAGLSLLATAVTMFFLPIFFKETLGYSGQQIGVLAAVQAVTGVLVAFPAGVGNDRLTSRALVVLGLALQAASLALLAAVESFVPFLLVFFLWAMSYNLCRLSLDVQVLKGTQSAAPVERRMAVYQGWRYAFLTTGTVLAGVGLAWLDFRWVLAASGILCLGLIPVALRLAPTPVIKARLSDYRTDLSNRPALWFSLWLFLFTSHWGAEGTSYGLFLHEELKLGLAGTGLYMALEFLVAGVTIVLFAPRFAAPGALPRLAVAGTVLSGLGAVGQALTPAAASVACRSVHGLGDGLMLLVMYLGISRLFKSERLGGTAGFVAMATMLGNVVGSLVYGPLGEHHGYATTLWISGAISLALVPWLFGKWMKALG